MRTNNIANRRKNSKSPFSNVLRGTAALGLVAVFAPCAQSVAVGNSGVQIVYTDSQSAVFKTDTASGGAAVLAAGQKLIQPLGIAQGPSGEFFITDTGCAAILGLNPINGQQRVVAGAGTLGVPFGIAVERGGTLLVANAEALLRVDPATGTSVLVSWGQFFQAPIAVAVAAEGDIYVVDALGAVIRVDPLSGHQNLISRGGLLHRPQGIAVNGQHIYVTDVATPDGNFGVGRVVHIDRQSGLQRVVSQGQNLVGPVGIAVAPGGQLIVGDPYTINEEDPDLFDGAILTIDTATGAQALVVRGAGEFVNPRCVAVVSPGAMR
jgi:DNA-binding beta-propeller fold protein YncE